MKRRKTKVTTLAAPHPVLGVMNEPIWRSSDPTLQVKSFVDDTMCFCHMKLLMKVSFVYIIIYVLAEICTSTNSIERLDSLKANRTSASHMYISISLKRKLENRFVYDSFEFRRKKIALNI